MRVYGRLFNALWHIIILHICIKMYLSLAAQCSIPTFNEIVEKIFGKIVRTSIIYHIISYVEVVFSISFLQLRYLLWLFLN